MPYIHDVIESIRERLLDLQNQIHYLRLAQALQDKYYPCPPSTKDVSRETKLEEPDGNGTSSLFKE